MRNAMQQATSVVCRKKISILEYAVQIIIVILLFVGLCTAQTQFAHAVGGTDEDYGYPVVQTTDGGYAVAGATKSFSIGGSDLSLVKFDSTGSMEWTKAVGGTDNYISLSIVQTYFDGYVVAGYTESSVGGRDLLLVKFNSSGSLDWSKAIGGSDLEEGYSIVRISDTGYVVAGQTKSYGAGSTDLLLFKFSCSDSLDWAKALGGMSGDGGSSVIKTTDSGYAVAGYTSSFGAGGSDLFLVKFSSIGSVEWAKAVGGSNYDLGSSVVQTTDGGYAVAGNTRSFGAGSSDLFLVKFSSSGSLDWAKAVGGIGNDYGYSVAPTPDGGCAVAGYTESFGAGSYDLFLVKFNSSGSLDWSKVVGGTDTEYGFSVVQTKDSGYAVAGNTRSFGAGNADLFLVKFDSDGNTCIGSEVFPTVMDVTPSIFSVSPETVSISPKVTNITPTLSDIAPTVTEICPNFISETLSKPISFELTVSPNPFNSSCAIMICQHGASAPCVKVKLEIYDLQGKLVWNKPSDSDYIGATSLIKRGKPEAVPINKGDVAKRQGVNVTVNQDVAKRQWVSASAQGIYIWKPDESITSGVYLVRATTNDGQQITKRIVYLK